MDETKIHFGVAEYLRKCGAPGLLWWHTPNDGKRTFGATNRLKRMGMLNGVSDIIAVREGKIYGLELKADKGRATEHQLKFLSDLDNAGGYTAMSHGLDRAVAVLKSWGLIRL
jgi:hypothetical protein